MDHRRLLLSSGRGALVVRRTSQLRIAHVTVGAPGVFGTSLGRDDIRVIQKFSRLCIAELVRLTDTEPPNAGQAEQHSPHPVYADVGAIITRSAVGALGSWAVAIELKRVVESYGQCLQYGPPDSDFYYVYSRAAAERRYVAGTRSWSPVRGMDHARYTYNTTIPVQLLPTKVLTLCGIQVEVLERTLNDCNWTGIYLEPAEAHLPECPENVCGTKIRSRRAAWITYLTGGAVEKMTVEQRRVIVPRHVVMQAALGSRVLVSRLPEYDGRLLRTWIIVGSKLIATAPSIDGVAQLVGAVPSAVILALDRRDSLVPISPAVGCYITLGPRDKNGLLIPPARGATLLEIMDPAPSGGLMNPEGHTITFENRANGLGHVQLSPHGHEENLLDPERLFGG